MDTAARPSDKGTLASVEEQSRWLRIPRWASTARMHSSSGAPSCNPPPELIDLFHSPGYVQQLVQPGVQSVHPVIIAARVLQFHGPLDCRTKQRRHFVQPLHARAQIDFRARLAGNRVDAGAALNHTEIEGDRGMLPVPLERVAAALVTIGTWSANNVTARLSA